MIQRGRRGALLRLVTLLLGLLVTTGSIVGLARYADWSATWRLVLNVGPVTWLMAGGLYLLGFLPRALRWRTMLADHGDFPARETLRGIVLGYTANNLLPFRLGELVRALVFSRLTRVSRAISLGSIVAERVCDGVTIVLILADPDEVARPRPCDPAI